MRYLDIDKTIKAFEEQHGSESTLLNGYNADWILSFIESQHTADVQEVRHGEWIYCGHHEFHGHVFECSVCGRYLFANSKEDVCVEYPYCHCGAKMDEEEQE